MEMVASLRGRDKKSFTFIVSDFETLPEVSLFHLHEMKLFTWARGAFVVQGRISLSHYLGFLPAQFTRAIFETFYEGLLFMRAADALASHSP